LAHYCPEFVIIPEKKFFCGLKITDTTAFVGGVFQFPRQFRPDAFHSKGDKQPEKYRMFRCYTVFPEQETALFVTALEGLTQCSLVAGAEASARDLWAFWQFRLGLFRGIETNLYRF
jgi:hypothetical protein